MTAYEGRALARQVVAERLTAADLFVGVANLPLRVLEKQWVSEEGVPDALWISLSNGRTFTLRYDNVRGIHRVYVGETECGDTDTGLPRAVVHELARELFVRFAEGA